MAFVYILHSNILNKYYIGSTESAMEDRLRRHLSDHKGFTGKVKDWKLVYLEETTDKKSAIQRENQIKSWKSRIKIEELIKKSS
jgi:putative endonuclease